MRRQLLLVLMLCPVTTLGQIAGGGTTNQVPQFTSSTTIGDSPIRIGSNGQVCSGDTQFCEDSPNRLQVTDFRGADFYGNPPVAFGVSTACPNEASCGAISASTNGANSTTISATNYAWGETGGVGLYGGSVAQNSTGWGAIGVYGVFSGGDQNTGYGAGVVGLSWSNQGTGGSFINQVNETHVSLAVEDWGLIWADAHGSSAFFVNAAGDVFSSGSLRLNGTDYSTALPVAGDPSTYEAGDVLAIDPMTAGRLARTMQPYSTRVAGVYATQPAVTANYGYPQFGRSGEVPLAIAGVVPCKATTQNGPIRPGDLLVTSASPGYAMKGTERGLMLGAVIGKALEPLNRGKGVIKILVTLQ